MENKIAYLETQITTLQNKIARLESLLLSNDEYFYQNVIEQFYNGKHIKVSHGIVDIITDNELIEIKRWNLYKQALGQLQSYSISHPDKKLVVIFFGERRKNTEDIIQLFKQYNIEVRECIRTSDGIDIRCLSEIQKVLEEQSTTEFYKWLDNHIEFKEGEILKLSNVCEMYLGKKVGPRTMNKYKKKIEQWIKEKYPTQKWDYQHSFYKNQQYKGWLNFEL